MQQSHIGIIDSGVGGVSVYAAIKAADPTISVVYLADSAHVPYGTKSEAFITERSAQLVSFLSQKGVDTIVIACNTITVTCLRELRVSFPEITFIGTVPVIKTASEVTKNRQIGVLSTIRTTESTYLDELISEFATNCIVTSIGTDELVPLVEKGQTMGEPVKAILERVLEPFITTSIDTLVLGCTHFPFLAPLMQEVLGENVQILDSGDAIARQVGRVLGEKADNQSQVAEDIFYTTGDEDQFKKVVTVLLGEKGQGGNLVERVIV